MRVHTKMEAALRLHWECSRAMSTPESRAVARIVSAHVGRTPAREILAECDRAVAPQWLRDVLRLLCVEF